MPKLNTPYMDESNDYKLMINEHDIKDMKELNIPQPAVDQTLQERGERYGNFETHAQIAQGLKQLMWVTDKWVIMQDDQKQALEVIADKIARILNGDPDYIDNWHDIQGYAKLVEDRLLEDSKGVFS